MKMVQDLSLKRFESEKSNIHELRWGEVVFYLIYRIWKKVSVSRCYSAKRSKEWVGSIFFQFNCERMLGFANYAFEGIIK